MRKSDIQLVEDFMIKHDLRWLSRQLHELCMKINASGWCDGSNDYIEDWDEEE